MIPAHEARFEFTVDGLSEACQVLRWEAEEGVSRLYEVRVTALVAGPVTPAALVGSGALLRARGAEGARLFHGIVADVSEGGRGMREHLVEFTVVPRAWRLLHAHDCRIFQQKTVEEIVRAVLEPHGLSGDRVRTRLAGAYAPREYCVQYRESDWAFVSRLCEEEGIFYFFEHDEAEHALVFADDARASAPLEGDASVWLREATGQAESRESVSRFRATARLGADRVRLQDFHFLTPSADLTATARGDAAHALERYDYPGGHGDAAGGRRAARLRLEALRCAQETAAASSNCARMTPGRRFTLVDPDGRLRDELRGDYVVLAARHRGEQRAALGDGAAGGAEYGNELEVLPAGAAYRPPRATARPVVQGVQTAIVVGPAGEEIYTDAHGRVKVHFHWDRLGRRDERSSCWVRVSQAWAGEGYGFVAVPRVGHEVVVSFLEGDPDRPLVTGRVYHAANVAPEELPARATRTTLKSSSSPGGGGSNELRFEDAAGAEEVYLHAERDWNALVERDKGQRVGRDESLRVGNDRAEDVGRDLRESVGRDRHVTVGGELTEEVGANRTVTVHGHHVEAVRASRQEDVAGDATLDVGGDSTTEVRGAMSLTVLRGLEENVLLSSSETVGALKGVTVAGAYTVNVGAAYAREVLGPSRVTAGGDLSEHTRADLSLSADGAVSVRSGGATAVRAEGAMRLSARDDLALGAEAAAAIAAADAVSITCGGATVVLKKNGDVVVKGGKVRVEGSGDVVIKGSRVSIN